MDEAQIAARGRRRHKDQDRSGSRIVRRVVRSATIWTWLNAGAFNRSAGLVAATPVPDQNTFRALVAPNTASATNDFMKQADLNKAWAARAERMQAMQAGGTLLPKQIVLGDQFGATTGSRALMQQVSSFIPATFDTPFTQAHVALIAAQAGITSTIQLASGGFDGHSQLGNGYNGANGALARIGVLPVRADALDRLARITDLVFDKTGTLSDGKPVLEEITLFAGTDRDRALALAHALERDSGHPIAAAFAASSVAAGTAASVQARDVTAVPGQGIEGTVDGVRWRVGHAPFAAGRHDDGAIWLGDGQQAVARFVLGEVPRAGRATPWPH